MKIFLLILIVAASPSGSFSQRTHRGDIVINEILFNPPKDGYDYVEGLNNSGETIDLRELKIAKRSATGEITSAKKLSSGYLPSGGYFVVTGNEKWLRQRYPVPADAIVCQVSSMPSFPDDEGTVVFLNGADSVVDELNYFERWHFPLIADPSGVALERIEPALPTQDKNNWASASSSSGYGTPGAANSQSRNFSPDNDEITVPKYFSPDNDGVNDFALIQYKPEEPGTVANTMVYDMAGRRVRYLVKNESLGNFAQYKWDGLDENSRPLPQGIYIIVSELFNLNGKVKRFRNAVVVARR